MGRMAQLVWNNTWPLSEVIIPECMGTPRADQMQGSKYDQITELSGRVCYDSVGLKNSRSSLAYHPHIIESKHFSTNEHPTMTFRVRSLRDDQYALWPVLCNRHGMFVQEEDIRDQHGRAIRITCNARTIREWFKHRTPRPNSVANLALGKLLAEQASRILPLACGDLPGLPVFSAIDVDMRALEVEWVAPEAMEELWYFFHVTCSRGASHELVRHADSTSISQRSSRFLDEGDSDWDPHPLIARSEELMSLFLQAQEHGKEIYRQLANKLEVLLRSSADTVDVARKQARGAARGVLGNALQTQLIFGASLSQWKWMIHSRACKPADGEIRVLHNQVYEALSPLYPEYLSANVTPSADGIGKVIEFHDQPWG